MKKLILLLLISTNLFAQCPITGDGSRKQDQYSDSLKNRNYASPTIKSFYVDTFFMKGEDYKRFCATDYVQVRGVIKEVKWGGKEQCNCHSNVISERDIHIVFTDSLGIGELVCEINRFTRATNKDLSYEYVKSLIGKEVLIEGWLFPDIEHKQNATNTCVKCTHVWRTTLWEIHPVINIKPIK